MNEEDIKRIEKKVDLLFKLCFKDPVNYTFGSFLWDEIKECIPLFGISAKKVDIKDFPTEKEIEKYKNKIDKISVKLKKELSVYRKKYEDEYRKLSEKMKYSTGDFWILSEQRDVLKNQYWDKQDEHNKKIDELYDTIDTLTYNWFRDSYFGEFNTSNCVHIEGLKDSIEKNYRAQFVNDLLKKLGIKRREEDYTGYIGKVIEENKQLKEVFKKIDNYS